MEKKRKKKTEFFIVIGLKKGVNLSSHTRELNTGIASSLLRGKAKGHNFLSKNCAKPISDHILREITPALIHI